MTVPTEVVADTPVGETVALAATVEVPSSPVADMSVTDTDTGTLPSVENGTVENGV